jgi:lipopolysaccharide biosynthesis glycosyltransferase
MADSRIAAVLAADDRFSRPMAATVRSIVAQLSPDRGLDLYLCDMGITQQNREKIAAAAAYLTDGRHQFLVDQEAINAVLPGRIGQVDPRWNVQTEHFQPQQQGMLPLDEEQLAELVKDPWIVHFTTAVKAWSYECTHPFRDEWFANLDQTPYRGWRPSRSAYLAGQARGIGQRVQGRLRPRPD